MCHLRSKVFPVAALPLAGLLLSCSPMPIEGLWKCGGSEVKTDLFEISGDTYLELHKSGRMVADHEYTYTFANGQIVSAVVSVESEWKARRDEIFGSVDFVTIGIERNQTELTNSAIQKMLSDMYPLGEDWIFGVEFASGDSLILVDYDDNSGTECRRQ